MTKNLLISVIVFFAVSFCVRNITVDYRLERANDRIYELEKNAVTLVLKSDYSDHEISFSRSSAVSDFGDSVSNFKHMPLLLALSDNYNIRPELLLAVIYVESKFDPGALSLKNARGLMQITDFITGEDADPWDIAHNLLAGTSYMSHLIKIFSGRDCEKFSIAAYNCGPTNVKIAQSRCSKSRGTASANNFISVREFLPEETKKFVKDVIFYASSVKIHHN